MRKILVVGRYGTFQDWKRTRPEEYKARQLIHIDSMVDAVGRHPNFEDIVVALDDADPTVLGELRRRGFIVRTPLDGID